MKTLTEFIVKKHQTVRKKMICIQSDNGSAEYVEFDKTIFAEHNTYDNMYLLFDTVISHKEQDDGCDVSDDIRKIKSACDASKYRMSYGLHKKTFLSKYKVLSQAFLKICGERQDIRGYFVLYDPSLSGLPTHGRGRITLEPEVATAFVLLK